MTEAELVRLVDHTLLKPEAPAESVRRLCAEARRQKKRERETAKCYTRFMTRADFFRQG